MAQNENIIGKKNCNLLVSIGVNIEKAFHYGRWARNVVTESSDIDVILVSSAFELAGDSLKARTWRAI